MTTETLHGMRRRTSKRAKMPDEIVRMAESLALAWERYYELFGVNPHGSVKQLAALIELSPQMKEAIRLFEKQREESMTV